MINIYLNIAFLTYFFNKGNYVVTLGIRIYNDGATTAKRARPI